MKISATVRRKNSGKVKAILQDALRKHGKDIQRGMESAMTVLKDESLSRVPRDTHALADSARVRTDGKEIDARVYCAYGPEGVLFPNRKNRRGQTVTAYPWEYAMKVHQNGFNQGEAQPEVNEDQVFSVYRARKDANAGAHPDSVFDTANSFAEQQNGGGKMSRAQYDRAVSHFKMGLSADLYDRGTKDFTGLPAKGGGKPGFLSSSIPAAWDAMRQAFRREIK